jgi:hypothetical protein
MLFELANVSFRDLTGDGHDEAIVSVQSSLSSHGSASCTYFYNLEKSRPELLDKMEFSTGAYGGLRRLDVVDGRLLVEKYVPGKPEPGGLPVIPLCCPKQFSRLLFKWDGTKFVLIKKQLLSNDSQTSVFLGYPDPSEIIERLKPRGQQTGQSEQ